MATTWKVLIEFEGDIEKVADAIEEALHKVEGTVLVEMRTLGIDPDPLLIRNWPDNMRRPL